MSARVLACAALVGAVIVGCGGGNEEAPAPSPPPADTASLNRAQRPPAGTADLSVETSLDAGNFDAAGLFPSTATDAGAGAAGSSAPSQGPHDAGATKRAAH